VQTAPDQSRPSSPQRQSGAASTALSAARATTAIELRHADSLRRDAAAGRLPRGAAISAIRDCLRHARYTRNVAALLVAGTLLAACAPQTPPVLGIEDNTRGSPSAPTISPVEVHEAVGRAIDTVRPEPRPEVR
jgi:hypothetical protein